MSLLLVLSSSDSSLLVVVPLSRPLLVTEAETEAQTENHVPPFLIVFVVVHCFYFDVF